MPRPAPPHVPGVTLRGGAVIPQVGIGVWQVDDAEATKVVRAALDAGYRSVDTAAAYDNESGVGAGLRGSGVPRGDLFVTTKVWNADQGYGSAMAACRASLDRLRLDYVDLYLINWPLPSLDRYVETWRALVDLRAEGLVRSIGVSNFTADHLRRLEVETGEVPAVNQVELHPRLAQAGLRAYHAEHGIVTEAWSPLAQGRLMAEPVLLAIARRLGVSVARVILRWHLQVGIVVIPKSVTPSRIVENIDLFDFALSDDDMAAIAALDRGARLGPDPAVFDWQG